MAASGASLDIHENHLTLQLCLNCAASSGYIMHSYNSCVNNVPIIIELWPIFKTSGTSRKSERNKQEKNGKNGAVFIGLEK